jgi:cell division protein FtsL
MKGSHLIVAGLVSLNLVTALGIVYTKHQSRMSFKELRTVQKAIDSANTEWGRLQIEESTLARFGRIEDLATRKLNMRMPDHSEIKMVVK